MKKFLSLFTALILFGSMMVVQAADTWTPAGIPASVFTNEWTPNTPANDMVLSNGLYVFAKKDNFASKTSISFKVCKDHAWTTAYPGSNYGFDIPAGSKYLIITYNTSGNAVNAFAISSMTVAGDNATLFGTTWNPENTDNDMVLQDDGTYKFEKEHVTLSAGTVNFKACANHSWDNAWPSSDYVLSIPESGNYTITITFNPATLSVSATADLEEAVVVIPNIQLHSNIQNPSWASTANFDIAGNNETASLTLENVTKGNYEFGVKIDGTWTSNGSAFTRANNSYAIAAGSGNCTFNADRNGDYTFTWTYATNTLSVTYPAVPTQSVTFNSLASEILNGSVINLANCVTSSGIEEPTYRFYIKEKNGSYGDAINANYNFNANGEYVVKVEALEYGEPVAFDESNVVVYQSYTFTNGSTIYVDFSAVSGDAKGVNYPKVDQVGMDWDGAGAGTIKTIAFTANVTWTTMAESFIKTEKNGWANQPFTVPGIDKNCVVVAEDGASYTWGTYVPAPPTIKMHGNFLGEWNNTDAFVVAGNKETASLALTIPAKGMKSFGVRIGSDDNWTSNGAAITRASASASITAGEGNCSLNADIPGEYLFTWTYATNTLSVTYPELPSQFVEFDGLESQILKGTEVTFAANSSGITNPVYTYFVKTEGGEYGSAVTAYTFNAEGNFVVKVSAEGDNTAAPVVAEENVSVYDAHTFTSGTTIFVDFSAMTEGGKGVNYPSTDAAYAGSYDAAGAGTVKTVTFSTNVTWTTNDVFIKTEKAGWDPGMKFSVPGDGQNCVKVAADGASFTWDTYVAPAVTVQAKGGWNSWGDALEFVTDGSGLTATATLSDLPAGNYEFKLIVNDNWLSNENAYHRFWTSASGITENLDNMELQADADGDYILTWTFATNALSIEFPATPKEGSNEVKFFAPRTEDHPWDHVYVYVWRRGATEEDNVPLIGEWPGVLATKDGEWYKVTADKGACVIFHDNAGMQSFDIMNVQKDVCYIANVIDNSEHEADPEKPIKAKFYESCTVNFFLTGDEGIMGAGNAWKENLAERQLNGSNSIELHLAAGIYEFKLTNGSWAWSLGGKEHLNNSCSNAAATTGSGNVKFKLEDEQDVTISYNPTTQKICLSAETVLPFEDVRTGLTADNYYTVCFNREMRQIRGASLWSFIGRDADFAYIVKEDAPIAAGKPFIVFAESEKLEAILDGDAVEASAIEANGALHGTFSLMDQDALNGAGNNIYLIIDNLLRRVDGQTGNRLPAYRAYVDLDEIDMISDPNPAPGRQVRRMPMQKDQAQGFENIQTSDKPVKVVIDGALYILRGEKVYDATGRLVK